EPAMPAERDTTESVDQGPAALTMTIGGRAVSTPGTIPVTNPADESIAGFSPDCTGEQLDEAFASAQKAFRPWSRSDAEQREKVLLQAAETIESSVDELGLLLANELGRPLPETRGEVLTL